MGLGYEQKTKKLEDIEWKNIAFYKITFPTTTTTTTTKTTTYATTKDDKERPFKLKWK